MIKAKVTATADQLIDEGLYPQFCQPGQTIWLKKEEMAPNADYYLFYNQQDATVPLTIRKEYVRIIKN